MYESFSDIFNFSCVLVCSKPCQTFLEHVYPQGIITGHEYVYPQIVLEVFNQVWIGNILGNKDIFLILYYTIFFDHFYATTTRRVSRFHYPESVFVGILSNHFKPFKVEWEDVRSRYEVIRLRERPTLFV